MSKALSYQPGNPDFGQAAYTILPQSAFQAAYSEITQWDGYEPTKLHSLPALARRLKLGEILYKDEGSRFGLGSFKALGGAYAALCILQREISQRTGQQVNIADIRKGLWAEEVAKITLVSATDGNHGRSLAWGCQKLGAPCQIYIHAEVSQGRETAMQELGAKVIRIAGDYDASVDLCRKEAEANDWFVVSDTSWPGYTQTPSDVMAGYGVMTREIVNELSSPPSHIFLQGGVGGLAAAVASSLRQQWGDACPRVCIAEPELAACLFESAKQGQATSVAIHEETIMAGLSCGVPSPMAWEILHSEASDFVTISDKLIAPTMRLLAHPEEGDPVIKAGESGVAGLAALIEAAQDETLRSQLGLNNKSRIVLIGSEGVTDAEIYKKIMQEKA